MRKPTSHVWIPFLAVLLSFFQVAAMAEQRAVPQGVGYVGISTTPQDVTHSTQAAALSGQKVSRPIVTATEHLEPFAELLAADVKGERFQVVEMFTEEKIVVIRQPGTLSAEKTDSPKKGLETRRIC